MSASKNKLLTTLSALGLVAAGAIAPAGLAAYAAEGGPTTEATTAAAVGSVQDKVAFVQAHPKSIAAQKVVAELVAALSAMAPAERAAALDEIAAMGGIPSDVPGVANTPFGAPDIAGAFSATATGATTTTQSGPASVY